MRVVIYVKLTNEEVALIGCFFEDRPIQQECTKNMCPRFISLLRQIQLSVKSNNSKSIL